MDVGVGFSRVFHDLLQWYSSASIFGDGHRSQLRASMLIGGCVQGGALGGGPTLVRLYLSKDHVVEKLNAVSIPTSLTMCTFTELTQ